jgi:hypothetical protein
LGKITIYCLVAAIILIFQSALGSGLLFDIPAKLIAPLLIVIVVLGVPLWIGELDSTETTGPDYNRELIEYYLDTGDVDSFDDQWYKEHPPFQSLRNRETRLKILKLALLTSFLIMVFYTVDVAMLNWSFGFVQRRYLDAMIVSDITTLSLFSVAVNKKAI